MDSIFPRLKDVVSSEESTTSYVGGCLIDVFFLVARTLFINHSCPKIGIGSMAQPVGRQTNTRQRGGLPTAPLAGVSRQQNNVM